MKQLNLTIEEFFNFKAIAKFIYDYSSYKGFILVEADAKDLELIGF